MIVDAKVAREEDDCGLHRRRAGDRSSNARATSVIESRPTTIPSLITSPRFSSDSDSVAAASAIASSGRTIGTWARGIMQSRTVRVLHPASRGLRDALEGSRPTTPPPSTTGYVVNR